ncbi:agmatinase [Gudongella sp. SC589]|uniref:agmatinase n=1 Tax=Gudongella sp. SC589 TaxID=3385990 RepID=UPI003904CB43
MMKETKDMINDRDLWAGLNNPDLSVDEADIVVFGLAYDGAASFRQGAKDGPKSIRGITYSITPTTEDFELLDSLKVLDLGDFHGDDQIALFDEVKEKVSEIVRKKKFFTMLGGDHSTSIPIFQGIDDALDEPFGIIHLDAHFDLNDQLAGSRLSHGCPARRSTELKNVGSADNIYFVGIRSVEMDELDFMKNNKVNVINARKFNEIGIANAIDEVCEKMKKFNHVYVTVDIDVLDPAYAAGTGTPQFGGLSSRELLEFLRGIFKLPIIGFDVVEVAPNLDSSLTSSFAARKIITECWGHYSRNIK